MRKPAMFPTIIKPRHSAIFITLQFFLRQLGLLPPALAYQPCPVKPSHPFYGKRSTLVAFIALAIGFSIFPTAAQGESFAKRPTLDNARFSNQVQMDSDQILTPFQLRGTYKQTAQSPAPKVTHGIVGLDLQITQTSYPLVVGVFPDTPAEKQGFQAGDLIVSVNGVQAVDKTRAQVDAMISDRPGDTIVFIVGRGERLQKIRLKVAALESLSDFARSSFTIAP